MSEELAIVVEGLDIVWITIAAAMVMFMQAGFTCLESGLTRAKNTVNVALKNLVDLLFGVITFYLLGFALMFGASSGGWFGTDMFALAGVDDPGQLASFSFQAMFAATAATIVSGAIAERTKFGGYIIISVVTTALIYPISGHWVWGDGGWLAELGFYDFAGSTVVHSVGAWIGLAGAIVIGPRLGRYNDDGSINEIPGHNLVLAVLGGLILFFGWFGFNGGSTLEVTPSIAPIIAKTVIAAAAGGAGCFLISVTVNAGRAELEKMVNGVIGGLVGITAGASVVTMPGAFVIGLIAGAIVYLGDWMLSNVMGVDDPVRVVPAHGLAGAAGTILVAVFAPIDQLPLDTVTGQLGVQTLGVVVIAVWAIGLGFLLFGVLRAIGMLRVSPEGEEEGLNVHEHGAYSGMLETMRTFQSVARAQEAGSGDLVSRLPVERGSEAGELAEVANALLQQFHDTVVQLQAEQDNVSATGLRIKEKASTAQASSAAEYDNLSHATAQLRQLEEAIQEVGRLTETAADKVRALNEYAQAGAEEAVTASEALRELGEGVESGADKVESLNGSVIEAEKRINEIRSIAENTQLLALNASIEAARAGDEGRGFAVVASEVQALAQQTEQASNNIQTTLSQVSQQTIDAASTMRNGKKLSFNSLSRAQEAIGRLREIATLSSELQGIEDSVASAAEQQSASALSVRQRMDEVERLSEGAARSAKEQSDELDALLERVKGVSDSLVRFRTEPSTRAERSLH